MEAAIVLLCVCLSPEYARPDTAQVLPKGVVSLSIKPQFYFTVQDRFDPDGHEEKLGVDYNAVLDSTVFPQLALLENALHLPAGSAVIGRSVVSIERDFTLIDTTLAYGITERLSCGLKIPYWFVKNTVDAGLDASHATVGKNAGLNTLAPLSVPGTVPLTPRDVINLLGAGLDINGDGLIDLKGYGYKRFGTKSQDGVSDLEGAFKYQYLRTPKWQLAASFAAIFPTGEIDDTDDLVDYGFGNGVWGLIVGVNNDFTPVKDLLLDLTLRYKLYFSDSLVLRVPEDVNEPITSHKVTVDRDIGDVFELEASAGYTFREGWTASFLYKYGVGLRNKVTGPSGLDYSSLEDETDFVEHVGIIGLTYSTISLFQAKKCPLPFTLGITYRNRFAGENAYKSQYIALELSVFF